jgi:hypothetical protein
MDPDLRKYGEEALRIVEDTFPIKPTAEALSALRDRRLDPCIAGHVFKYHVGVVVGERLDRGESTQEMIEIDADDVKSRLAELRSREPQKYGVKKDEGSRRIKV